MTLKNTTGWYKVSEVAEIFNASESTVRALIKAGYIDAIRIGSDNSSYRVSSAELERFSTREKSFPAEDEE